MLIMPPSQRTKIFSLKDRKSARLKLAILESALDLMGKGSFKEINVEQIADAAEVSRGTLFNYFPRKEDIMLYYFEVWNFRRAVEQSLKPKSGLPAIRHLFTQAAKMYQKRPGVALSIVAFIANLREKPARIKMQPAEKALLYPDFLGVTEVPVSQLYERFDQHVDEAITAGEISPRLSRKDIVNLFETMWYGGFLVAHISGKEVKRVYESNLQWLTSGLN